MIPRGAPSAAGPWADAPAEVRVDVRPPWPFRLRRAGSPDGLTRRRGAALQRLVHVDGEPVLVGVVQRAPDRVTFGARAGSEAAAHEGIARMRFATGVDDDLAPFHAAFRSDPVIGRALRASPALRVSRRPDPWEALLAAVTEQLIEIERAVVIQRRLIARLGRRCPHTGFHDAPTPAAVAGAAPAELERDDLAPRRALVLRRVAREVASGRVRLREDAPEVGWARLRRIPGVGAWTVEMVALNGQGRHDQVPAADLGYLKLVGRLLTGDPRARADEAAVRAFFAPYGEWKGLAGAYLRRAAADGLLPSAPLAVSFPPLPRPARAPRPAAARSSAPGGRRAAA